MFGNALESPQTEKTPFNPRSPYACGKITAHFNTVNYREMGLHASCGILFNHESPKRGENFVTRKITKSLSRIKLGLQDKVSFGNLNSERDWGFAGDYVEAMWLMLQQEHPDDYVIGTGEKHSAREFLELSAKLLEMDISSNGEKGLEEKYFDNKGNIIVDFDERFFRPTEVDHLLADYSKAKKILGWKPKITFKGLVEMMVKSDFDKLKK